jgi:RHS repeat-associated protein
MPDLHGNVAAFASSTGSSLTDAFRYDAYGLTIGSQTSTLPTPWRFQGRLLESTPANRDLYDFGARSYAPDLGVFTQLDTYGGSALNPLSMNRYLYANANPATLIDPTGHVATAGDGLATSAAAARARAAAAAARAAAAAAAAARARAAAAAAARARAAADAARARA